MVSLHIKSYTLYCVHTNNWYFMWIHTGHDCVMIYYALEEQEAVSLLCMWPAYQLGMGWSYISGIGHFYLCALMMTKRLRVNKILCMCSYVRSG